MPPGVGAPRLPPSGPGARLRAWVTAHPRASLAGGVVLVLLLIYPFAVGALAAHLAATRASAKLGRPVTVGQGRAGLLGIVLSDVTVTGPAGGAPLATVARLSIPYGAAVGLHTPIEVSGLRVLAVRGGDEDNVSEVLARLRGKHAPAPGQSSGPAGKPEAAAPAPPAPPAEPASHASLPDVTFTNASIEIRDEQTRLRLAIPSLSGELRPGTRLALRMRGLHGGLAFGVDGGGPRFGADELDVETPLSGLRPTGIPSVRVAGGTASPLPTLALTGIAGVIAPAPAGLAGPQKDGLIIDLRGSYGGARETLWTAKGDADPAHGTGKLALRAEQFSLARIADVLPASVLRPNNTLIDAALDLSWLGDAVKFAGDLAVVGLSVQNDGLAADPIENVSVRLGLRGTAYPLARRVDIERG